MLPLEIFSRHMLFLSDNMFKSLASLRGFYYKGGRLRDGLTDYPGDTTQRLKNVCPFKSAADCSNESHDVRIPPLVDEQD